MSRLLIATVPLTGHVQPMVLLVRALIARGHTVHWYGGAKFRSTIEATGARFVPMRTALDWDDADVAATIPALKGKRGLGRVKTQIREMFIKPMGDQLRDLDAIAEDTSPHAIIADSAHLGALLLSEKRALPYAGLGISALMIPSIDTAPFGPGFPPVPGEAGRRRNRIMNWLVHRVMFKSTSREYQRARVAAGLPATNTLYFEAISPYVFLQPTIPAFEYPRSDLPPQVQFIGPLVPREQPTALPSWWTDVEDAHARGVPIVLVTQGTLATDARELIRPALRGLATEDVLVVVTGRIAERLARELPTNARVAPFVPYQALLPKVSVLVTNAGYGGVQMALCHGVPIVAAGGSEEKPEIAARIAWSGAGINLKTGRPSAKKVRAAVRQILDEDRIDNHAANRPLLDVNRPELGAANRRVVDEDRPEPRAASADQPPLLRAGFRARARELAAAMATYDAPTRAAELIEQIIATGAPIVARNPPVPAGVEAACDASGPSVWSSPSGAVASSRSEPPRPPTTSSSSR